MDPRQRQQLEVAIEQGEHFSLLQNSPQWPYFRAWVDKLAADYERRVHDPNIRADHVALARALEGYDAVHNLLANFDRAINEVPKRREELDGANHPGTN